jgi:hypothetical protein
MITHFENVTSKIISPAEVQKIRMVLAIIKAEIIISSAIEKDKVEAKVREMASDLVTTVPWVFYTEQDIRDRVAKEYEVIGEI